MISKVLKAFRIIIKKAIARGASDRETIMVCTKEDCASRWAVCVWELSASLSSLRRVRGRGAENGQRNTQHQRATASAKPQQQHSPQLVVRLPPSSTHSMALCKQAPTRLGNTR